MKKIQKNIDKMVSSILNEIMEEKATSVIAEAKSQMDEKLKGGQKKLDVAEPKGKLTKADFDKLRDMKEESYGDTEMDTVKPYGDFEITKPKVGKVKNVGDKYEREVSKEFNEEVTEKHSKEGLEDFVRNVMKGMGWPYEEKRDEFDGRKSKVIGVYSDINKQRNEEDETLEGNEFSGALADAKEKGKDEFEVDGKIYKVKESKKSSLVLSEEELIDLIEKIVMEQTEVKDTNKSLKASETVNNDYIKSVTKKMKNYLKTGSKGEYEMNPKIFPKGNGELAKMAKKAYVPSKAVEEYEDAFSYPGQTNLRYDEIQPNDEVIEKYLEGDSSTGNSQEAGNAVASDVGKKFMKNYKENLYGAEQADASYKRQPQPVDVAGEVTSNGDLKSKRGKKTSAQKAQDILNQLESVDEKSTQKLNEEMDKMRHLLSYKQKTQ
jgi:hypothetical protein